VRISEGAYGTDDDPQAVASWRRSVKSSKNYIGKLIVMPDRFYQPI